jgi:hypothetical protein
MIETDLTGSRAAFSLDTNPVYSKAPQNEAAVELTQGCTDMECSFAVWVEQSQRIGHRQEDNGYNHEKNEAEPAKAKDEGY